MEKKYDFDELVHIIAELRSEHGCPWDRAQTFESLKKCLSDEVEDVFQAVDNHDDENLCEELGDVLMQVLLYCEIAGKQGAFTFEDVVQKVSEKLIRRHPHVFGDVKMPETDEEALELWRSVKAEEKRRERS